MKYVLLLVFGIFFQPIKAQDRTDYKTYRDSLNIVVCGNRDSVTLTIAIGLLSSFDTTAIQKNMHKYYSDLAVCNWELAQWSQEDVRNEMIKKGIVYYHQSLYHEPKNAQTLWNTMFSYYAIGDCENALNYLKIYKENEKRKYWDKAEIEFITNKCSGVDQN